MDQEDELAGEGTRETIWGFTKDHLRVETEIQGFPSQ